jgi:hypothetical protein
MPSPTDPAPEPHHQPTAETTASAQTDPNLSPELAAVGTGLAALETDFAALKQRYQQVICDRNQAQQIEQQLQQPDLSEAAVQQLHQQLQALEINLESHLFQWGALKEPFWQAVRFGGVGLILGWLLAFATMRSPEPAESSRSWPVLEADSANSGLRGKGNQIV